MTDTPVESLAGDKHILLMENRQQCPKGTSERSEDVSRSTHYSALPEVQINPDDGWSARILTGFVSTYDSIAKDDPISNLMGFRVDMVVPVTS